MHSIADCAFGFQSAQESLFTVWIIGSGCVAVELPREAASDVFALRQSIRKLDAVCGGAVRVDPRFESAGCVDRLAGLFAALFADRPKVFEQKSGAVQATPAGVLRSTVSEEQAAWDIGAWRPVQDAEGLRP